MLDHNFKKKYGQNWLHDKNVLTKIINTINITKDDLVIEIGPGTGNLTKYLTEEAGYVIAYEIDKSLEKALDVIAQPNLEVIFDDFLKRDIISDIKGEYKNVYVIGRI